MNAYEINKFIGAILAALVFVMGLSVLSDIIFDEEELYDPAYRIAIADEDERMVEEEETETPFAVLLASADPAAGESAARVCGACHAFEEGGANGIGPYLHNVVGREIAAVDGFNYSGALSTHGEGKNWSYEELDGFLENPQGWVPGTSMGYAGIRDAEQRADVIAYMRSVSPDAPPLPDPPAEEVDVAAVDTAETATDATEAATTDASATDEAPAGTDPFVQMVASADPAAGEAAAAVCLACHSVEEGAAHRLGPNLHGVFNGPVAAADGFTYSPAMQQYAEAEPVWNIDTLSAYLEAPMEVVQGTNMAYAGVKDEAQRADIIAWLHSLSPEAGPIVTPATETAAADSAATEEAAVPPAEESPAAIEEAFDEGSATETAEAAASDAVAEAQAVEGAPAAELRPASRVTIEPADESNIEIITDSAQN